MVLGATVTEMTRTFHRRPWRLDRHLDRLFRSLRYTRMDIGLSKEKLAGISCELVAHNAQLVGDGDELGLIHFIAPGEFPTYAGMAGRDRHAGAGDHLGPHGRECRRRGA